MIVWHAQEHPTSGVAACVRMVFAGVGETWTEAEVRRVIGHTRLGLTLAAAQARLVEAGARLRRWSDSSN